MAFILITSSNDVSNNNKKLRLSSLELIKRLIQFKNKPSYQQLKTSLS